MTQSTASTASTGRTAPVWHPVCAVDEIPLLGARVVRAGGIEIAVFRTTDDHIFALHDRCPHKAGPLSQGIVHGRQVTCPLHSWKIGLDDGQAAAPDVGCAKSYPVRVEDGRVFVEC